MRSYATFLIQIITLLLTTVILVIGWVAKDYATEKYRLAQRVVIPESRGQATVILASPRPRASQGPAPIESKPIYALKPAQAEKRMDDIRKQIDYINRTYWAILIDSPTTSLLLAGFSAFGLLVLGLLLSITFQLQRRRYQYHDIGTQIGMASDEPVADSILIRGALNDLMILVGLAALGVVVVTVLQTVGYILHAKVVGMKIGLSFVLGLLILKTVFVSRMALSYYHFEKTEGWKARWRRVRNRLKGLESEIEKRTDCSTDILGAINALAALADPGSKASWRKSPAELDTLIGAQIRNPVSETFGEATYCLIMELHLNKWFWWSRFFAIRKLRTLEPSQAPGHSS